MNKQGDTLEVKEGTNDEEEDGMTEEEKSEVPDSPCQKENVEDIERYYLSICPHFGHYSEDEAKKGYIVEFEPEERSKSKDGDKEYLYYWAKFEAYYLSRLKNELFPSGRIKHLEGGDA